MTKDVKYYRDLQPGETLQAGDEALRDDDEWVPVLPAAINAARIAALYGMPPFRRSRVRRPVDLPVLQPVTPEAMAELEGREVIGVLFVDGYGVQVASYNRYRGWWWCGGIGKLDRPTRGWFIELSTIPEVQQ